MGESWEGSARFVGASGASHVRVFVDTFEQTNLEKHFFLVALAFGGLAGHESAEASGQRRVEFMSRSSLPSASMGISCGFRPAPKKLRDLPPVPTLGGAKSRHRSMYGR